MNKLKIPKILQIKGVHPQDCITLGSIFETDRLLISPDTREDIIPSIFQNKQSWIVSSNINCINCTLPFDSVPVPCPVSMQRKKNSEIMFTLRKNKNGRIPLFCSFECLINYIYENIHNESDRSLILKMIEYLAIIFGVHSTSMKRGLSREDIDTYGGLLSVKKFKNQIIPIYWNI